MATNHATVPVKVNAIYTSLRIQNQIMNLTVKVCITCNLFCGVLITKT